MTIAAILQTKGNEVLTVDCATTVRDAVTLLAERKIGALPVLRAGQVAGIMSERDIIYCLKSDGAAVLDWPVEKIMTAPAISVAPSADILGALSLMTKRRIRHLPVVEGAQVLGVISIGDLVKSVIDAQRRELDQLQQYIVAG